MSRWCGVLSLMFLMFSIASMAQDALTIHVTGKQKWPQSEPEKIYSSACAVLQQEFRKSVRPQVNLVLGADKDIVAFEKHEIRLTKWNAQLFAQGVVLLGFADLMPLEQSVSFAHRAVNWSETTVQANQLRDGDKVRPQHATKSLR